VLYNLGRVISYTIVGSLVGALGMIITPSGHFKGIVQIVTGIFMVLLGVNMLGLFPFWRRFSLRFPVLKRQGHSPFFVGLLNGLMPCAPLQAMQIYALSTGSPLKGALSMFLFSLGTVPLMLGLGALSSVLSKKFRQKIMTIGAVLVTALGLLMCTQGAALSGFSPQTLFSKRQAVTNKTQVQVIDGVQYVNSELASGDYPDITVRQGLPVKWTIVAPQDSINGCNKSLTIPEYGITHDFEPGENVIEFVPDNTGTFVYSCWMGMIRGTITVIQGETS